jgi:hypothetical protein
MPFKSEAQRRKFGELVQQGKMSKATFDEWNNATGKTKLPERIGPPKVRSVDDIKKEYTRRFGR